jgi:hypothetical protein
LAGAVVFPVPFPVEMITALAMLVIASSNPQQAVRYRMRSDFPERMRTYHERDCAPLRNRFRTADRTSNEKQQGTRALGNDSRPPGYSRPSSRWAATDCHPRRPQASRTKLLTNPCQLTRFGRFSTPLQPRHAQGLTIDRANARCGLYTARLWLKTACEHQTPYLLQDCSYTNE